MKKLTDKNTIVVWDFNTPLIAMDRLSKQKKSATEAKKWCSISQGRQQLRRKSLVCKPKCCVANQNVCRTVEVVGSPSTVLVPLPFSACNGGIDFSDQMYGNFHTAHSDQSIFSSLVVRIFLAITKGPMNLELHLHITMYKYMRQLPLLVVTREFISHSVKEGWSHNHRTTLSLNDKLYY